MAGFEPAPQGLEGPQATVTPHSPWFGLRVSNPSLRAGNAGCFLHTQAEQTSVIRLSKNPLKSSWWVARDSNPSAPRENGFTARQRTIRSYHSCWRQRQDSNLDPRALEARMLPLHHAADRIVLVEDRTLL